MALPCRSKIGWTDYSGGDLNFVIGCTPVSEGCKNCYARAWAERWDKSFAVRTYPDKLERLRYWKPDPGDVPYRRGPGSRPMAFVVDLGDLFHEAVPTSFIYDALDVMVERADIDWQILTKRPERMRRITRQYALSEPLPPHIWLGTTVENQQRADERIPRLLRLRADGPLWISIEPMLGPVDVFDWLWCTGLVVGQTYEVFEQSRNMISWVIVGAESGPDRRPYDKDWARDIRDQCIEADVPFFYKQSSGLRPGTDPYLDGRKWQEWPR